MNINLTSLISAFILGTSAIAVSFNCEKTKSSKKTKIQKGGQNNDNKNVFHNIQIHTNPLEDNEENEENEEN